MRNNLSFCPKNSLSYTVLVAFVVLLPSCVLSIDDRFSLCNTSFSCANLQNLSYPFWKYGRESCGHPGFELNCTGNFAEINISSVKFRVLEVSTYDLPKFTLARTDYIGNLCPRNLVNATFDERFLEFNEVDAELLTLYYQCPDLSSNASSSSSDYIGEFSCVDENEGNGYYITKNLSNPLFDDVRTLLDNLTRLCKRSVTIPASASALATIMNVSRQESLVEALGMGFEVRWSDDDDCLQCVKSKGFCGYDSDSAGFICVCEDKLYKHACPRTGTMLMKTILIGLGGALFLLLVLGYIIWVRAIANELRRSNLNLEKVNLNLEEFVTLKRYSHAQIKEITKSFSHVVGRGGFGTIYRGNLPNGRKVAVKVLKNTKGNGEEFINEVASMSKTSHVNIVSLLGFCCERPVQVILYEFLENGSLDKLISRKASSNIDTRTLYNIALDVSRGLAYLHHGCKTRIVHFDIKPQNILLDEDLCPKVSDFGLAKLCEKKDSILSLLDARGTIGYIAPEVFSRIYGGVSHKSDVYSYGMLVLDMVGARNRERAENSASNTCSSMYFPDWIYKDLEKGDSTRFLEGEITEEEDIVKKMMIVGLWCVQYCPSDRPPMNKVVEMMEASVDSLEVPPKPVSQFSTSSVSKSEWSSDESLKC